MPIPGPHKRDWSAWRASHPGLECPDSRFELRYSTPDDFPEIYGLINSGFPVQRSAGDLDWLYHENPYGPARCELVVERASGRIIHSNARIPWPLARGDEFLEAAIGADSVTRPDFQRQGLYQHRKSFEKAHPWFPEHINISLPNNKSRGASRKYGEPSADAPMPILKRVVNWQGWLADRAPLPAPLFVSTLLTNITNPSRGHEPELVETNNFTGAHEALSLSCNRTSHFWCPHGAEWMNWRYNRHPRHTYISWSLIKDDEVKAFSVVSLRGKSALLMELVAPDHQTGFDVLASTERYLRESGVHVLEVFTTPNWHMFKLFKQRHYYSRPSDIYVNTRSVNYPEAHDSANWQLLPGDSDVH